MDELNDAESRNIAEAILWLEGEFPYDTVESLLDHLAMREIHRRMFEDVWTWAGKTRQRETNIGVDPREISTRLVALMEDVKTQIATRAYPPTEIGVRFHRDLVAIHCFPNGNGRHARLAANELGKLMGIGPYTWGRNSGAAGAEVRRRYLEALALADRGDYLPLVGLARS